MKKLAVIANCGKARAPDVLRRLAAKARELGIELHADEPTAALTGCCRSGELRDILDRVDAVMALGGDGTMLRVVREMDGQDKPVIGVNIGGLGFLTSVAEEDLERALECLASDRVLASVRVVAEGTVLREGKEARRYRALNELLVSGGPSLRVVTLDLAVDGDAVSSYVCDGILVSTPTGSTGHSLSAGGPIVTPDTPAFVISPICPHTLSSRPLVVPDRSEILVTASRSSGDLLLIVDGQTGQTLAQGDALRVRRSDRNVRFLRLPGHSYFSVLRQKLRWSGKSV